MRLSLWARSILTSSPSHCPCQPTSQLYGRDQNSSASILHRDWISVLTSYVLLVGVKPSRVRHKVLNLNFWNRSLVGRILLRYECSITPTEMFSANKNFLDIVTRHLFLAARYFYCHNNLFLAVRKSFLRCDKNENRGKEKNVLCLENIFVIRNRL